MITRCYAQKLFSQHDVWLIAACDGVDSGEGEFTPYRNITRHKKMLDCQRPHEDFWRSTIISTLWLQRTCTYSRRARARQPSQFNPLLAKQGSWSRDVLKTPWILTKMQAAFLNAHEAFRNRATLGKCSPLNGTRWRKMSSRKSAAPSPAC